MSNCCKEPKLLPDWKKVFVSREDFLKLLGLALSGLMGLVITLPGIGFMLSYLLVPKRDLWVPIGPVEKYKEGQTVDVVFDDPDRYPWDGTAGKRSAWLRREPGDKFLAFAINCTHLGCPVRWETGPELFLCPCHGGVYYSNGEVAGGPPPRPLHQYPVRIANGNVEIQIVPVLTEA